MVECRVYVIIVSSQLVGIKLLIMILGKEMTISFVQDPFDGRCLTILNRGTGTSSSPAKNSVCEPDDEVDNGWRRVLYEHNRNLPDNYTPDTFLSSLSVNIDVKVYEYFPSVVSTVKGVWLHACLVPIFFVLYYFLRTNRLNPLYLISLDVLMMISGYAARWLVVKHLLQQQVHTSASAGFLSPRTRSNGSGIMHAADEYTSASAPPSPEPGRKAELEKRVSAEWPLLHDLTRAFLVFGTVYIVSPLLRTLTRAWSEDTIIAIAVTMLIIHLALHDYTFIYKSKSSLEQWHQLRGDLGRITRAWKKVDNSVALNAIIFSAIVLASRLSNSESVFGFIFFSVTAFAFLPFVLKCLNLMFPNVFLFVLCPFGVLWTTLMLQIYVGALPMAIFISIVLTVAFVCPYLLIRSLPLKKAIKGPWDIAHVNRRLVPPTPMGRTGGASGSFIVTSSFTDSALLLNARR